MLDFLGLSELFIGVAIIGGSWIAILSWFYESKRLIRWRKLAMGISVGFSLALIFNVISMLTIIAEQTIIAYLFFYLTMASLIISFIFMALIGKEVASFEKLGVGLKKLKQVKFEKAYKAEIDKLGVPAIDSLMMGPVNRAPIVISGAEGTHPYRIAQRFVCSGLVEGEKVIYFAVSKPPEYVLDQLDENMQKHHKKSIREFKDSMVIVDCFTPFASLGEEETFPTAENYKKEGWKYVSADPRDLNDVHEAYRKAEELNGYSQKTRIVYDTFTAISQVADPDLLYQYLLHNIAGEDRVGYISLYVLHEEIPTPHIPHLVAGLIRLKLIKGQRYIEIDKMPGKFRPGAFKLTDDERIVGAPIKSEPASAPKNETKTEKA